MNITPLEGFTFLPQDMLFAILWGITLIMLVIAIIMAVIYRDIMENVAIAAGVVTFSFIFGSILSTNIGNYVDKHNEINSYVAEQGFEITEGTAAVYAGDDKTMTVTQDGQDFSCTSYAPENPEEHIFFVCDSQMGVGRSSLEDLKLQLDKASERESYSEKETASTSSR